MYIHSSSREIPPRQNHESKTSDFVAEESRVRLHNIPAAVGDPLYPMNNTETLNFGLEFFTKIDRISLPHDKSTFC